jgi:hypothetical protein
VLCPILQEATALSDNIAVLKSMLLACSVYMLVAQVRDDAANT